MNHDSNLVSSAVRRALSARGSRSLGVLLVLSVPSAAQAPRLIVSTTDDVAPTVGLPFTVTDGDLVKLESGQAVAPFLASGHFHANCGFIPSDVDAFAHLPGSRPGSAGSNVFSLLSNEGGFLDGDLLVMTDGTGVAGLLVSELDVVNALGASGANVDVDALAYDDQGRILFSLADNLAASALGPILDGDVLRLDSGLGGASLVLSEADVQTRFTQATGMSDAILDVQALEWAGGALWAAVQSPTRHDGSVIALNGTPTVVADEQNLGLGGAEIDALADVRVGDEIPVFHMSADHALAGDTLHVEVRGRPGAVQVVFMAGQSGFIGLPQMRGFGGIYVNRLDPWFAAQRSTHTSPVIALDGNGRYAIDWALPTVAVWGTGPAGELGWSFQVLEVGPLRLSAPFRVQKL